MNFLPLPTNLFLYWYFPWNTHSFTGFTPFISHKELLGVDSIRQIFVWKEFSFSLLKTGILPLWNPYNFSGQPLIANFQSSVFYPLSWFFLVFPPIIAWSIYVLLQPLLVALFMWLYLRGRNFSRLGSLFGAISLASCSYFATRYAWGVYVHSLLYLPLILFLIDRLKKQKMSQTVFLALAGLLLTLTILGGYPQHGLFVLILGSFYFLFELGKKKFLLWLGAISLSILMAGVQFLPTLELYQNSHRSSKASEKVFSSELLETKHLVSLALPDYFGNPANNNYDGGKDYSGMNGFVGVISLPLAVYALLDLRKSRNVRFWAISALLGLVFAYDTPLSHLPRLLKIPVLSSGAPWNNMFFFQFGVVILSVLGFERARKSSIGFLKLAIASFLALNITLLLHRSGVDFLDIPKSSILIIVSLLAIFAGTFLFRKFLPVMMVVLSIAFGLFYVNKMTPWGETKNFYPQHQLIAFLQKNAGIDRFWGYDGATLASNFATHYEIFDPQGYDSLWPKWYGELLASGKRGSLEEDIDRADVRVPETPTRERQRLLNLLGVKYFLDRSPNPEGDNTSNVLKYPPSRFKLVRQWADVSIYENKEALPRFFLAESFVMSPSTDLGALYREDVDLRKTIIVDESFPGGEFSSGEVTLLSYHPNEVVFRTKNNRKSLFFLSDSYYPGWKSLVNGREEKIYKANYSFRSVIVPAGTNDVRFVYDPLSFKMGALLSLLGLLIFSGLLLFSKRSAVSLWATT